MRESIKAPLVLTIICALVCALLAVANQLTADKIAATEAQQLQDSLTNAFGQGDYTKLELTYPNVNAVIGDTSGRFIFDITSSGYEKNGQRLLIGIDQNGAICGVCVVSISDSPTQSKKVQADAFLGQFTGLTASTPTYDAIAGATKSSSGIHAAVSLALDTYTTNKEAILNAKQ